MQHVTPTFEKKTDDSAAVAKDRQRRMKWWHEARFGMFIHWGLYSQLGRDAWAMNHECIPVKEYEKLAQTWKTKDRPAREWARLAKKAGMKYMQMTTKHHEGFCLWDTRQTDYNSVKMGPGKDLVREYVEACREYGLKVGLYYSLIDWRHPDGAACAHDEASRRRFLDFTQGCLAELCSNYGKIDILWYDLPRPIMTAEGWESVKMNGVVRQLQPDIIINQGARLPEDFDGGDDEMRPSEEGRAWEAPFTFNGSWGYMPSATDWKSTREVITLLLTAAKGQGNFSVNIGPAPDGSVPEEAVERLTDVGKWLGKYGEAVYGRVDRALGRLKASRIGDWTLKGKTGYLWIHRWLGKETVIGGLATKVKRISRLDTGRPVEFAQKGLRLELKGLPPRNPDKIAGICVLKVEFASSPEQVLGYLLAGQ